MRLEAQVVQARSRGILVEEVGDELVIYDVDRDEAHHLSSSAAAVWRRCAEPTTVEYVAAGLVGYDDPLAITWHALVQLESVQLLDTPIRTPHSQSMDRRRFLRNLAIASVAVPVVTTIVAQTPASAACNGLTNGGVGQPCCSAGLCNPGNTCITEGGRTCCCNGSKTCPGGGCSGGGNCCSGVCLPTSICA